MSDDQRLIQRLLSKRPGLSRVEKEDILARVLDGAAEAKRRAGFGARVWAGLVGGVAVAAALAFVLVPGSRKDGAFIARGGSGSAAVVRAFCGSDPTGDSCHAGEPLFFEVGADAPGRYFAAYARRADGTVIWYFPHGDSIAAIDLASHVHDRALDRQVILGPEHEAGTYDISFVFSPEPVTRDDIKRWVADPQSSHSFSRAQQRLVVR